MTKATSAVYAVHFKRRRQGRTDYAKRLALLKSGKPRMVIRKTNRSILVEFCKAGEKGDEVLAAASSKELEKYGFKGKRNTPSAYLAGLLAGRRAAKAGVKEFVADFGLYTASKGSVLFASLKGAVDAGLETGFGQEKIPPEERLSGKPLGVEAQFSEAKQKIMEGKLSS